MSFLSAVGGVFKKIGQEAEKVMGYAAPFENIINLIPGPAGLIFHYVVQAEHLVAANSNGAEKKAAVVAFVHLAYPKLDSAVVSTEVDNLVGILNRLAAAVEAKQ